MHPQYLGNVVNFLVLVFAIFGLAKVLWIHAAFSLAPRVLFKLRLEDRKELFDDLIRINLAVLLDKLSNLIDIDLLKVLDLALFLLDVRFAQIEVYRVKLLLQEGEAVRVALPLLLQLFFALVLRLLEVLLLFLLGRVLVLARVLLR